MSPEHNAKRNGVCHQLFPAELLESVGSCQLHHRTTGFKIKIVRICKGGYFLNEEGPALEGLQLGV